MNYLLRFFDEHQPRRIRVIENTLRNRRTVSTLFWAKQYGILGWTGADRSLNREKFDQLLENLVQDNLIKIDSDGQAVLTTPGILKQEELKSEEYQPQFLDWYWLANTNRVERRLLLGVQVVSELTYHNRHYAPLTNEYQELQLVKRWLFNCRQNIIKQLTDELKIFGSSLANADERLANYFFYSLIGHQTAGENILQLSKQLGISTDQMPVVKQDALLAVAAFANSYRGGALNQLLADLLTETPLSYSANQTLMLYQRGQTIEQIAKRRRIKANTVREHLLETAIVYPTAINWDQLLPGEIRQQLAKHYQGDVSKWQFKPEIVPGDQAAFYYFRLYQLYREKQDD
ncbi:MAG: helix-turn-helix domain-containing protein [Limosilactobacillus sp.]|uniref:helix-turn-helix domain-containing protein n=1 Tax=Limosilactobacillus sp. TaxID=2773925 RepID=UPI0025C04323|nr:helix-turn-helix domain-containing protein [Limosilactobacillus sp.]MCI1975026.1 helix-turn-helix domain-containing protein [Limosilactobacillus sp.]MCI2031598.1 helix-turn-helix domain-containing protein [Limosilactobacillus sp.]